MAFIKYCDRHRILLLVLPPHSTHTLQPLDVVLFSPLASKYSNTVTNHLHNSQALAGVKKSDFFHLFYKSWTEVFTTELVQRAFEVAAIHPQNRDSVVNRFRKLPLEQARTPSPFAGSEWREAD